MPGKIVIADDATFIRIILKDLLTQGGYEVVAEATDGVEAIKKYFEFEPDVLFMNINMGEVSGIKAMLAILQKDPNAKVIICSADSRPETVLNAIKLGAKSFIVKPFMPEKIYDAIEKTIGDDLKFDVEF